VSISLVLAGALRAHEELDALAWVDLKSGTVMNASTRTGASSEALELAAVVASELCGAPRMDARPDQEPDDGAREVLVVSGSTIHAFARPQGASNRVVVGVAGGAANVALLLASVRSVAAAILEEEST